jgi:hypothetical protein
MGDNGYSLSRISVMRDTPEVFRLISGVVWHQPQGNMQKGGGGCDIVRPGT